MISRFCGPGLALLQATFWVNPKRLREAFFYGIIMFECKIISLRFSGGDSIPVDPNSLLIITGPNNTGKTQALKDIEGGLRTYLSSTKKKSSRRYEFHSGGQVVKQIEADKSGSQKDLADWLDENYYASETSQNPF